MATKFIHRQTPIFHERDSDLITVFNYTYTESALLGAGNFSRVYAGTKMQTNQKVAIKVVELASLNTQKLVELHRSELKVLSVLRHQNIVKFHESFIVGGKCFIVTDLYKQGDLEMKLKREGAFSQHLADKYIRDVFEGLCYLYDHRIVHRDIKAGNVLLNNRQAIIVDFGFAAFANQSFKDLNLGSPFYMAPQSFIDCTYSSKSDIWSFGIFIYELLHGSSPYSMCKDEDELRYYLSIPFNRAKITAVMSLDLKQVMLKCLQINPQKRASISELKQTRFFRRFNIGVSSPIFKRVSIPLMSQQQLGPPQPVKQVRTARTVSFTPLKSPQVQKNSQNIPKVGSKYETISFSNTGKMQAKKPNQINPQKTVLQTNQNMSTKNIQTAQTIAARIQQRMSGRNFSSNKLRVQPSTSYKQLTAGLPERKYDIAALSRRISSNRHQHLNSSPVKRNMSIGSVKQDDPYLFINSQISFKTAVNILHYCRALFRCIKCMIALNYEHRDIQYLTGWLVLVLDQANNKLNGKGISFEGSNSANKQKMFRDVRNQYERKYTTQLKTYTSNFIKKPALSEVQLYLSEMHKKLDLEVSSVPICSKYQLCHILLVIYDATRLLNKCQGEHSFSRFQNYKQIQNVMAIQEGKFTASAYSQCKNKMII